MTLFDRYLMKRLFIGLGLMILALIVFFVVLHYVEYGDDFHDRDATLAEVFFQYYPAYIPEIIQLTSPLALFLVVVYITGQLAQYREMAALMMTGVSLYRIAVPYILVGIVITGAMFGFNGWVVPPFKAKVLAFETQYLRSDDNISPNDIHLQIAPNEVLTIGFYDKRSQVAHPVYIEHHNAGQLHYLLTANSMRWEADSSRWRFNAITHRHFDDAGATISMTEQTTLDTVLTVFPRDLARSTRDTEVMTIPESAAYIASLQRAGATKLGRPLVNYYSKFAYPFANVILVLIGVALASARRKGGQTIQMVIGFAVAFIYLSFMKILEPLGYTGDLEPLWAAVVPHVVFLLLGIALLLFAKK